MVVKNNLVNKKGQEHGGVIENKKENYPPVGDWSQEKPEILDGCIACGQCVRFCPEEAITIKEIDGKRKAVVDFDFCKGCRVCEVNCPVKVIKMKKV